jgi:peptidyl-prolyl cis-trans isomerase D
MSVIQKIQDKYAKLMAIVIAVALMIFVVMLAFENGGNLFQGGNTSTVGKVNGTKIEYNDFMQKVDQQEKTMEQRGYGSGSALQQQAIDAVWNEEINQIIQTKELDKTGIAVGRKEMGDVLYGPNAPDELKKIPGFTDSITGIYNGQLAKQQIDAMLRMKKGPADQIEQRNQLIAFINYHENARLRDKYNALLTNSINYPKWYMEKQIGDNSQMARISLVRNNYASVNDSTIKVTDKEIQDYLDKHEQDFKQQMLESRSISYVSFSTMPSADDTSAARDWLVTRKAKMDSATDINAFLRENGGNFNDAYVSASTISPVIKDTIAKLPVNQVYGPYIDGGAFNLAKVLGVKQQPDSVKVRHILVATNKMDPQTRQSYPIRDTVAARKLIDSIQLAIRNGAKFDSLVKLSDDDPNSENPQQGKYKGGVYDRVTPGQMVGPFNDFIFGNPVGSKGVVPTEFGYHYVEILSQKGSSKAYKIAYLSRPIEASAETENNASNMAAQFAGDSRDKKSFDANAEKLKDQKGVVQSMAADIVPSAYQVPGLGQSRSLVKNIYKADLGDVLEPEKAGENWVVAVVTEINEEGAMSLAKARMSIEPILRNKKIAEKLIKQVGNVTTLEAAAAALGGKPIEPIDSLRMREQTTNAARAISSEPKVIGAAFNPANKGKVVTQVIEGRSGVYVIRVDDVTATAVLEANVTEMRKSKYQAEKGMAMYRSNPIQILRESATIKDKRIDFF